MLIEDETTPAAAKDAKTEPGVMPPRPEDIHYEFGKNWASFIEHGLTDEAISQSRTHLTEFLRLYSLRGLTFLDIGCGSGLHSLAAHQLGAQRVISFDYDPDSVATTERVRLRAGEPGNWTVLRGSVLDREFMVSLPEADVVYSWGVLHHTGSMWQAVRNAAIPLKNNGLFYIALYSTDNYIDPPPEYWLKVKRTYNRTGRTGRRLMEWWYVSRFQLWPAIAAKQNPLRVIAQCRTRGMAFWTDVRDWLGGYPMEFASLRDTQWFARQELGLDLVNVDASQGCAEYLFCHSHGNAQWRSIIEQRKIAPLPRPFIHEEGSCFIASLPGHLQDIADGLNDNYRSPLMLYEDGRILGLSHRSHSLIMNNGAGRFSHWDDRLYFSASDNSNPNTNRRNYDSIAMVNWTLGLDYCPTQWAVESLAGRSPRAIARFTAIGTRSIRRRNLRR